MDEMSFNILTSCTFYLTFYYVMIYLQSQFKLQKYLS